MLWEHRIAVRNMLKKVQDLGIIRDVIKPQSLMSKENISEFKNTLYNIVNTKEDNFLRVFGVNVSKVFAPKKLSTLKFVATNNTFSESANCSQLKHKYGLDIDVINEKTLEILYRKYIL